MVFLLTPKTPFFVDDNITSYKNAGAARDLASGSRALGCRQAVRHGVLIPAYAGSNPATPVTGVSNLCIVKIYPLGSRLDKAALSFKEWIRILWAYSHTNGVCGQRKTAMLP